MTSFLNKRAHGNFAAFFVALAACTAPISAQGGKVARTSAGTVTVVELTKPATVADWKEFGQFRSTWTAAKGGSDLALAKGKASELTRAAKSWANSNPPDDCNSPAMRKAISKVKAESQDFEKMISKGADDSALTAKLSEIRESFSAADAQCKPAN